MQESTSKSTRAPEQAEFVIEVRPGEGGDDAETFALELDRALTAYTRRLGCTPLALESTNGTASRTLRTRVTGPWEAMEALGRLVGTHRIQRVPTNDKRGRRQTSTVTVALMTGGAQEEVALHDDDLTVDYYRGSGPGGQHRNKTSSAVRLRHHPSGIVVTVEHGRSQHQNLAWARAELTRRLEAAAGKEAKAEEDEARRQQITSGDRPAKSYTHTAWRDEVVCHETGERWRLAKFMQGRMGS